MSKITLPPNFPIYTREALPLVYKDGIVIPAHPVQFPSFFAKVVDVVDFMNSYDASFRMESSYNADALPVQPTPHGLIFDTQWGPFGMFQDKSPRGHLPSTRLLEDLSSGKVSWEVKCPVMEEYESLIGLLICQYGGYTGGCPDYPGMNMQSEQQKYPILKMLKSSDESTLKEFTDRGRTLLDMSTYNQQWDLSEFLWKRGVRWSDPFMLTGRPLESLVVASRSLQGWLASAPNDDLPQNSNSDDRVKWLSTWQERFLEQGGRVDTEPTLGWRSRLAQIRNWEPGMGIKDTPASLWVSRFVEASNSGLPAIARVQPHISDIALLWARFFTSNGVDLETIPVPQGSNNPTCIGFKDFWSSKGNSEEWVDLIQAAVRKQKLTEISSKQSRRPPPRPGM